MGEQSVCEGLCSSWQFQTKSTADEECTGACQGCKYRCEKRQKNGSLHAAGKLGLGFCAHTARPLAEWHNNRHPRAWPAGACRATGGQHWWPTHGLSPASECFGEHWWPTRGLSASSECRGRQR